MFVEPHDNARNVARAAKDVMDLFLRGVEGQVADVEGGGGEQAGVKLLLRER